MVGELGLGLVPYCLLVVVPLMGRMSDSLPTARALAAGTFATVVSLMPLAQASVCVCVWGDESHWSSAMLCSWVGWR